MPEPNDTSPWFRLNDFDNVKALDGSWKPIEVLGKRYNSSSPDSEDFIHDPLTIMIRDANDSSNDPEVQRALQLIEPSWHVSTLVVNHQATLSIRHLNVIAAINPNNPSVGIMIVKQNP
jgi:hypothetical protein